MKTSATLLTVKAGSASVYWSGTVLGRKPCQPECDVIPMRRVGLIHHSNHGVQYISDIYQNRLEGYGMIASTGSVGDAYDNALAETVNGAYKAELIRSHTPFNSVSELEQTTMR